MWETICDAVASSSGWNFGSKIPVYPILGFGPVTVLPSQTLKFGQGLALWVLITQFTTPPLPNWNLDRTWHFEFWLPPFHRLSPPPQEFWGARMWRLISVSLVNTISFSKSKRQWVFTIWIAASLWISALHDGYATRAMVLSILRQCRPWWKISKKGQIGGSLQNFCLIC